MTMHYPAVALSLLLSALLAGCSGEVPDTLPGQPIQHRQDAFQEMLQTFEPMGVMLRTRNYEPERFGELAQQFSEKHQVPWQYFTEGSNVPPTRAKDAVWQQAAEFEAEKQQFLSLSDALLQAAKSQNKEAVEAAFFEVEGSCRSCHDEYRNR